MGGKTSKKPIMIYLDDELEQYVKEYCEEYKLLQTRPSGEKTARMATGATRMLKKYVELKKTL